MNPDVNFYATGIQTIVKSGDFFSEPWMYRLKESSPYSGSTSLRHFLNLDLCIPLY
jgi:hypothetical protein